MLKLRSIKSRLGLLALALCMGPATAHAAAGIDTTTSDLPFSISGTQVMDLTTGGLNVVRGNITLTGCVLTGSGGFTSTNCPFSVANGRLSSTNNQGDWAGVFTGNTYGVYSHAPGWAGYFDGPLMATGATTLNAGATINAAVQINNVAATVNALNAGSGNVGTQSGLVYATQYQSNWAGYFYGNGGYGVYGRGTTWAGAFDGPVNVNGSETVNGNKNVNGSICINNDCRTVWPTVISKTVYQAGPAISTSCPSGQIMTAVSNNQSVCTDQTAATIINAGCPGGYALIAISNNSPVCTPVSTKNYPQLYQCPTVAIYGSDGGGTGCMGQVSSLSTCNTYSVSGNHTHTSTYNCSAI